MALKKDICYLQLLTKDTVSKGLVKQKMKFAGPYPGLEEQI